MATGQMMTNSEMMETTQNAVFDAASTVAQVVESVEQENKSKPLTDEELVAVLQQKGYRVARRTVAKYREQMNIPIARLRKEL